jgi:hypothetical protein
MPGEGTILKCEISGSHDGEPEDDSVLEYNSS